MKWQNHIIIGGAFGAVINPMIVPAAVLGATAPDWLEYVLKFFGIRVRHRGITHYVVLWLLAIAFFVLAWDWRLIGLGFAVGGLSHVVADSFTIAGVPFAWWSDARFHLFGGKLRTGGAGEYIIAGIIAILCAGWVMYSPMKIGTVAEKEAGFIPFFYDWRKNYYDGLVDGKEWRDNRMKFL